MSSDPLLSRPFPNSYWVPGSQLLAGEYPAGFSAAEATEKLTALLDVGVTHCIDLTEPDELRPYHPYLSLLAEPRGVTIAHQRLSIPDMDIPSVEHMSRILDAIDAALAESCTVYVHCFGGIGRTGTVVGCHLVRRGLSGDEALAEVSRLFRTMSAEKLTFFPSSPQTDEQCDLVRRWLAAPTLDPAPKDGRG